MTPIRKSKILNHSGHRETRRKRVVIISIEALNAFRIHAFRLQFFCHFAKSFHNQLRLVQMNPVSAVGGNEMPVRPSESLRMTEVNRIAESNEAWAEMIKLTVRKKRGRNFRSRPF
jgi:hypothetical protein